MRVILSVFVLLLLPALASAQHPCDVNPTANVNTKSPVPGGVCWNQKDEEGVAATATALKVFVSGSLKTTIPNPVPVGAANGAGLFYYRTPDLTFTKGANAISYTFVTADGESDASAAYTFSVVGGKPSKPVGARVEPR